MPLISNGPSRLIGGGRVPWYRAGGAPLPVAAYQPKGAASLAASYINLANPGTYNAAPGFSPTWSAGAGWIFDGLAAYLTTGGIVPTIAYTVLLRFSGAVATARYLFGCWSGFSFPIFGAFPRNASTDRRGYVSGSAVLTAGARATNGVIGIAGATAFYDGSSDGTIGSLANTTLPMYVGALRTNTGASNFFDGNVQAVAIYNTTLTAAQVAAVSAAMAAL